MKTKIVILDFDGTIGDSQDLIVRTMKETLRQCHLPDKTTEECARTIGLPLKACFKMLQPMSDEMADLCANSYRVIFDRNNIRGAVAAFPGVKETIKALHDDGLTVTIASSRGHHSLAAFVEELHLEPFISLVLGADDVEKAKPDAEPVLKTLRRFGLQPAEALVVGDTKFDILMGRNAGTITCGVTYGNGNREELQAARADYIIDHFEEIRQCVRR